MFNEKKYIKIIIMCAINRVCYATFSFYDKFTNIG